MEFKNCSIQRIFILTNREYWFYFMVFPTMKRGKSDYYMYAYVCMHMQHVQNTKKMYV